MQGNPNNTQKIVDAQGNTITYIDPHSIDFEQFSLNLYGEKTTDLYKSLNENFIKLTQQFYSSTQPTNPINGQNWFNKDDHITYKWLNNNWLQVDKDICYDSFMYILYDIGDKKEFVLNEFVFNFTMNNIKLYDQDMAPVKFIIDSYDSKKIILKQNNIKHLYVMVFHPKDRITNPLINKKIEIFSESGQTQYDIESFVNGSNINTLSVTINDTMLKNNEFYVVNNVLNIDGKIYRIKKNDKITIWLHGGSLMGYYSNLKITTNKMHSSLRVPKFFKNIVHLSIIDIDTKTTINPIQVDDLDDYIDFEFLDKKNINADLYIRLI